jgi:DnaJ like chaperone protein
MSKKSLLDAIKKSIANIAVGDDEDTDVGQRSRAKPASKLEVELSIIALAAEVMRHSGNNNEDAEKILFDFMKLNCGGENAQLWATRLNQYLTGARPSLRLVCFVLSSLTSYNSKQTIVRVLYMLASADAPINSKEAKTIERITDYLELSDSDFVPIRAYYSQRATDYMLLEIEETATLAMVKKAYRKMVLKYHPDKRKDDVSAEEANKKFREIQRAFEAIQAKLINN